MAKKTLFSMLVIGLLFAGSSCNHDRNNPGWAYMPDMYYSEPYNAYSPNSLFSDSMTMQKPIEGSIARGKMPCQYSAKSYPDQLRAGVELINPIEKTEENLEKGKVQYDIFCMNCHGVLGKGDGHLYTSKKYPMKPTSLVESYVQGKPDGEIFHIITTGSLSGLMGAHGSMITLENRWKIIYYLRELGK